MVIIATRCFYYFFGGFDWSKYGLFLHFDKNPVLELLDYFQDHCSLKLDEQVKINTFSPLRLNLLSPVDKSMNWCIPKSKYFPLNRRVRKLFHSHEKWCPSPPTLKYSST